MTFVHLPFSVRSIDHFVSSLVFMKGTLTSCCLTRLRRNFKKSNEPLDCAMANLSRSQVYVISTVICCHVALSSLTPLYYCNLPFVYAFFWLISVARYVFKALSIRVQRTEYEI